MRVAVIVVVVNTMVVDVESVMAEELDSAVVFGLSTWW